MFKSFEQADKFVENVITETRAKKCLWEVGVNCFLQKGGCRLPSWYLFGEHPHQLILRASNDDYDLVVSERADPRHRESLENLWKAIVKQLHLLF